MGKLNMGCGKDIRKGWINLDRVALPGADVVHDLGVLPLPLADQSLDEQLWQDSFEHVECIPLLKYIHGILKKGGKLFVRVPRLTSKDAFSDPTHGKIFTSLPFRYFTDEHMRSYYLGYAFARFSARILLDKRDVYIYNYLMEPVVNFGARTRNFYEGSPLRIFPATNIEVTLEK